MLEIKGFTFFQKFLIYLFKVFRSLITHITFYILLLILGPLVIAFLLFYKKKFPTKAAYIWSLLTCAVGGVEVGVEGREHLNKDETQIIIANHQSSFDIHSLILALHPFFYRFVVKKELSFVPIFGWALWLSGFPFVDRKDRTKSIKTLKALEERLKKEKMKVVIFPEGTRNRKKGLLPFKKGAFILAINLQCDIVIAVLKGTRNVQKRHSFFINPGKIVVKFLPPISTKGLSVDDKDDLINVAYQKLYAELPEDEK